MKIISWDWKETGLEQISSVLVDFGVYLTEVPDTGSDSFVVVIGTQPVTPQEAQNFFNNWVE